MPETSRRSTATMATLWTLLSLCAVGFTFVLIGIVNDTRWAMGTGMGVLGFCTLGVLGLHLLNLNRRATSQPLPEAVPEPLAAPTPVAQPRPAARLAPPRPTTTILARAPAADPNEAILEAAATVPGSPAMIPRFSPILAPTNGHARRFEKEPHVPAVARRGEMVKDMPLIRNIVGDSVPTTDPDRPGKTRGRCSGCGVTLWAPAQRPIRLRCPQCGKTAWIE